MEEIEHYTELNGLKLHTAEIGSAASPVSVFLRGFPEIWYSWRHQMIAVARLDSEPLHPITEDTGYPTRLLDPMKPPFSDLIADLRALVDSLNISKVFLIGKDFGSRIVYLFTLLHPERVSGIITLGVPYSPPSHRSSIIKHHSKGTYISRWQECGRAEADFGRFDCRTVIRNIYILSSRSEVPTAHENQEIMDIVDSSTPLPSWFNDQDLDVYASLYGKSGFQTALQVPYR